MSPTVKVQVLDVLGRQQVALEAAIERGNVGMQTTITRRMAALERALDNDAARAGDGDGRVADRV